MELEIERLSAWHAGGAHRIRVLDDVSFVVPSGAMVAVLGPSGSGKTTLLRTLAGLHPHRSGAITLGGRRVEGIPPHRRRIGLVPQDGALLPHLTVAENIGFGLTRAERRGARVGEMLDLLGLAPFARRFAHQLSGGQAQRVAVARALAPAPDLLLLDEPFSALDASLRGTVREGVRAALAHTGTTSLLVTHDQGEALSLANALVVVADGRVRQRGTPVEVYTRPADLWTGRFVGEANVWEGRSAGVAVTAPWGVLPHPPTAPGPVDLFFRPEQVVIDAAGPAVATVRAVRYFGHDTVVELVFDDGQVVRARQPSALAPREGARLGLRVAGEVRVFPREV